MKIVVTGHLGTLGVPLTHELRRRGHEVVGLDLRHSEDGVRADVGEFRQVREAIPRDTDMVYHLAAEFGRHNGEDYTEQLWRSNVIGTKNILRDQADKGYRLVFASSSEVYGERSREVLSEDMIANTPAELTNDYATSKWVNEGQIANAAKRWGTESMVLRFFNAYGPGEYYHAYRSVVCLFAYRALHGLPYQVYDGYHRVFQYVEDMIPTIANATNAFVAGETVNIGGSEYVSVDAMHQLVSECVGVERHRPEVTHLPLDAHNVVNKRPDITKARRLLGHDPSTPLAVGVSRTVDWMRGVYGKKAKPDAA